MLPLFVEMKSLKSEITAVVNEIFTIIWPMLPHIRDLRYVRRGVDIGLTQTNILNNFRRSNERLWPV